MATKKENFASDGLTTIKEYFEILTIVSGKPYVPLWKLASELGCKQVWLFQFIKNNPDHFVAEEFKEKKTKRTRNDSLTESLTNEAYSEHIIEKEVGFVIHEVFISPADNPLSQAWLDKRVLDFSQYVQVFEGKAGHYIKADKPGTAMRESQWRNTAPKVKRLAEKYGLYEHEPGMFMLTANLLGKLYKDGWRTNRVDIES